MLHVYMQLVHLHTVGPNTNS